MSTDCYTYIIRCLDNSLYTGYTTDIKRRMDEHKRGINSKYTKARKFAKLEIFFVSSTKSDAMKLEYYIKSLTKKKKLELIKNPEIEITKYENSDNYKIGNKNILQEGL